MADMKPPEGSNPFGGFHVLVKGKFFPKDFRSLGSMKSLAQMSQSSKIKSRLTD